MSSTRIVRTGVFVAIFGLAGCGAPPQPSGSAGGKTGGGTSAGGKYDGFNDKAKAFAADFLKAVRERRAAAAQLTAEFKKVYAPAEFEEDKAKGYSDAAAAENLKLAATEVGEDPKLISADGRVALFVAKGKAGERTLLRVAADGEPKADWLGVGPKNLPDSPFKGDADAAQFTAMAFLDAALTRKFHLAEGLLSDAGKMNLGKSELDGKYNVGALKNKLAELFGGATQYTVTAAAKDTVTATVGGKTATVKLAAGRSPSEMTVDQVEVK
jgi:hypothetical protein